MTFYQKDTMSKGKIACCERETIENNIKIFIFFSLNDSDEKEILKTKLNFRDIFFLDDESKLFSREMGMNEQT